MCPKILCLFREAPGPRFGAFRAQKGYQNEAKIGPGSVPGAEKPIFANSVFRLGENAILGVRRRRKSTKICEKSTKKRRQEKDSEYFTGFSIFHRFWCRLGARRVKIVLSPRAWLIF